MPDYYGGGPTVDVPSSPVGNPGRQNDWAIPRTRPDTPSAPSRNGGGGGYGGGALAGGAAAGAAAGIASGGGAGQSIGGALGSIGGGLAGGALGGALTLPAGGFGAGALGAGGSVAGGLAGAAAGRAIDDLFRPPVPAQPPPYVGAPSGADPPFRGGQNPLILYRINGSCRGTAFAGTGYGPTGFFYDSIPGVDASIGKRANIFWHSANGVKASIPVDQGPAQQIVISGFSATPMSGGADTGGDPPPTPVPQTPAPWPPPRVAPDSNSSPQPGEKDDPRPWGAPPSSPSPGPIATPSGSPSPPPIPRPAPPQTPAPNSPGREQPDPEQPDPDRPPRQVPPPIGTPGGPGDHPNLDPGGVPQTKAPQVGGGGGVPTPSPYQPTSTNPDGVPRPGERIEDTPGVRIRTYSDPNNTPGASYEPSGGLAPWGSSPLPVPLIPIPFRGPTVAADPGWGPWLTPEQADDYKKTGRLPPILTPLPGSTQAPLNPTAQTPATNRQGVPGTAPSAASPPLRPGAPPTAEPCNPCASLAALNAKLDGISAGLGGGSDAAAIAALDAKVTAIGSGVTGVQGSTTRIEIAQGAHAGVTTTINQKMGDALPGGLSGFLQGMQAFAAKAWQATQMDKVLNLLTFVTSIHNAAMLSSNLGSTLSELTGLALQTIGIKDEEGSAINVGSILGKSVENLVKGVVGEEVYAGTKITWNKLNRIVQTASQVIWTVRSMADSAREVTEWTAENTGKIGNALKKWGIVGENAYKWMPERITAQNKWTRQVDKFKEGVSGIDDAASSLTGALSEVRSIQQEANELKDQKTEFDRAIKEAIPKDRVDNEKAKEKADQAKTASQSPDVSATPREKGDAP